MSDVENLDKNNSTSQETLSVPHRKAKEHAKQLQRLQEKDPEFYQYLKDHDKELLEFNDGEDDEDQETALENDVESQLTTEMVKKPSAKAITTEMVDLWCRAIKDGKLGAVQSLLRAFRTACHCGDDAEDGSTTKFSIISSSVFNKIMVFVLNEMDEILRGLLKAPKYGGKKETIMDLTTTKPWGKYGSLMRLYLGNSLHILTEMTDEQMIAFTLKRVKASAVFLAAFPVLLRKYIQVALHSWGTGRGALPVISFLFLRDLCVRIGPECIETCLKGVYKAYVSVCRLSKSVSRSKLQQIDFLGNCVTELYGVDLSTAYQQAFLFIRQLAVVLRGTLTERGGKAVKDNPKGKKQKGNNSTKQQVEKAYQKVYDWQFINCLELWTRVICSYSSEADFQPLAYPLTQLIYGVACLVPTARYFPLRLRCVRMLNRIAGATGSFIPVSALLLDMLEMKELNSPPTGGVGKAVNLLSVKQVDKTTLKTRAFQENCVYSIVEELSEHLAQWSYSVGFFELSFIPLVRLRSFCKATKVDRFRREIKELIRQAEANCEFTNSRRVGIKFSPNDPAADSFLKAEKESGSSPLSKFVANLHLRTKQRSDSMDESSVIVGAESSVFGNKLYKDTEDDAVYGDDDNDVDDEAAAVFSSSWLPEKKSKVIKETLESTTKQEQDEEHDEGGDEDILEDLVLSSDDDNNDDNDDDGEVPGNDSASEEEEHGSSKQENKKRKSVPSANHRGKKQKLASASASLKKRSRPKNKKKKGSRH